MLPPLPRTARPRRTGIPLRFLVPVALLLAAAAAGAAIAVILTNGENPTAQVRTVTGPAGTTTVQQTVTQPTPPPPPPPPPPPAATAGLDGHTLNDRGYSLQQRGDYASALPLLQQAVRKLDGTGPADPYEGYANYNLGYTLYGLGRCSEAVTYLSRAEQLEPDRHEPKQLRKRAERC